jgi:uncharacterized peroxidase-related enzyme
LIYDYRQAPLSPPDRALCDFAAKLTLQPGRMTQADFNRLSQHGFSDEQITIAVQVIGFFNYINRLAEGLGIDPEAWMKPPAAEWRQKKACFRH